MAASGIDYEGLVRHALRDVVKSCLLLTAEEGLPGEHHFYIDFRTDDPGVRISPTLLSTYPEEMTIILQHQFADLEVDEDSFSVTLRFGGRPEHLTVPFSAVTSFVDPAAEFGLQWREAEDAEGVEDAAEPNEAEADASETDPAEGTVLPFSGPKRA